MFARKLLTGIVTGGVAASVIGLTSVAASAATDPDDSPGTPVAANLIGVGSDTSQGVMRALADAYGQTSAASAGPLFTYAATGGGQIALPNGAIDRPNGSGAGKGRLYGANNNADIDFARSSSAQSADETNANLRSFPYALDTLATVTATSSNAPASLTLAQIVSIYKGDYTNWNQVGGNAAPITAYIPQAGSGTRSFFENQLKAGNGGTAVTLGSNIQTFQENDDTLIKSNANAVAPFSVGRAGLLGSLRVEGGFSADRAIYNVVRLANLGDPAVVAAFGPDGFLCSSAATGIIEENGFKQLATAARGGVCGEATTSATTTFTLNERANTTTTLAFTSPSAGTARLVATVSSTSAPQGSVTFFDGSTVVASGVPLVSGQATRQFASTPGAHSFTAQFVPSGGSLFRRSSATTGGVVASTSAAKGSSKLSESFAAKAKVSTKKVKGKTKTTVKSVKGSMTVTLTGSSAKATGPVVVKHGSKTVGSATLSGGVATFSLKGLKPGKNKLTATWAGDGNATGSTLTFTVKAAKAKKK